MVGLIFGISLYLVSYFLYASSGGSGQTEALMLANVIGTKTSCADLSLSISLVICFGFSKEPSH